MSSGKRSIRIEWFLREDGGGEVNTFTDHPSHVHQTRIAFASLDELPDDIAEAIRRDGRSKGGVEGVTS